MHNEISRWLTDSAFPRLLVTGLDRARGGYVERFDWAGVPLDPGFKRVRVVGRQIYAFSHAALGGLPGALEAAQHGVSFLLSKARLPDGSFASRLSSDGTVIDSTADLYDLAFVLFSLAWWYRLTGEEAVIDVAEETVVAIRRLLAHPKDEGFFHRAGAGAACQQNPHMHLFEAAIFLSAFSTRDSFRELSDDLFRLTRDRLYDSATGTLAEYFADDWTRPQSAAAVCVEPGHHFEWCWLLSRYHMLTGEKKAIEIANGLFHFAHKHGFDSQSRLVFDEVDATGAVSKPDFRIWPNLEYLKALIAMQEIHPGDQRFGSEVLDDAITRIFTHFLRSDLRGPRHVPEGLWIDYISATDFSPKVDHIPASTFYHLTFAFLEVSRHRAGRSAFSGLPW